MTLVTDTTLVSRRVFAFTHKKLYWALWSSAMLRSSFLPFGTYGDDRNTTVVVTISTAVPRYVRGRGEAGGRGVCLA